jgi:hypothetical protein
MTLIVRRGQHSRRSIFKRSGPIAPLKQVAGMDWHAPNIREGRDIPLGGLEIRVGSPQASSRKLGQND